ncbi:deoxynucleotidyltransferase terminal-interacting protein 2-like [Clavelina lepadiformis]|uniref:deoxynucleotidyltransferase terminal-interacting protein 2-like n=1 Tax=Clavelina lepadiformis TaxID=159417 RepID=UPI004042481F
MPRRSTRLLLKRGDASAESDKTESSVDIALCDNTNLASITIKDQPIITNNEENVSVENDHCEDSDSDLDSFAVTLAEKYIKKIKPLAELTSIRTSDLPDKILLKRDEKVDDLPSSIDVSDINVDSYIDVDSNAGKTGRDNVLDLFYESGEMEVLKKSVVTPDFETKHDVCSNPSYRALKKIRKLERKATVGKNWYHMKAPELTEDVKRDLKILQMRSVLDPKRFYKHNDRKTLPKYFQMGKIMDNATDFYSSRLPKKQRKSTLADELLADANFKNYQKRKYKEIDAKRRALAGRKHSLKKSKSKKKTSKI